MDLGVATPGRRPGVDSRRRVLPAMLFFAVLLVLAGACAPAGEEGGSAAVTPPPVPSAKEQPAVQPAPPAPAPPTVIPSPPPSLPPVRARHDMVSAGHPLAVEAGLEILRAGGSAVDAAIATQLALNVVEPQSSGIGGGAFLMSYAAKSGEIAAYDGRETAPAAATPDMFLDSTGRPRKFYDAVVGGLSVGVPGVLRMLELAHRRHGRLPWAKLFEPAIRLAEKGFPVSARLHDLLVRDKYLRDSNAGAYFYDGGVAKPAGTVLTNPELAATFRLIAEKGPDAFYTGPVARDIVAAVRGHPTNPGRMSVADLARYKAKRRDAVCLFYRVWLACGMPPPSSGGVTTLQILGILQSFDLAKLKPLSAEAVHLVAEASRLAFADRNAYIADPDVVPVPVAGLLDPGYLKERARTISPDHSMGKASPGELTTRSGRRLAPDDDAKGASTTHISAIDSKGNAVSLTSSIESAFGARLMVRGFLLNNQLTDFSFEPVKDGQPVANRAGPGKRPRSSMAPTLVFDGQGRAVMAIGSPGGSRIIGYVAQALINVLDWKMDIQAAVDMPHYLNRNGPTELEQDTPVVALRPALEALGHKVVVRRMTSGLNGITAFGGGLAGGADRRREGVAAGD